MNDTEIAALVTRLARPHRSGGVVIERAALMAAGADYPAILEWITAHAGVPESPAPVRRKGGGLHGGRLSSGGEQASRQPTQFLLPPGALTPQSV
jgi:hypothetical protein